MTWGSLKICFTTCFSEIALTFFLIRTNIQYGATYGVVTYFTYFLTYTELNNNNLHSN